MHKTRETQSWRILRLTGPTCSKVGSTACRFPVTDDEAVLTSSEDAALSNSQVATDSVWPSAMEKSYRILPLNPLPSVAHEIDFFAASRNYGKPLITATWCFKSLLVCFLCRLNKQFFSCLYSAEVSEHSEPPLLEFCVSLQVRELKPNTVSLWQGSVPNTESENHRIIDSQNSPGWKGPPTVI